MHLRRVLGLGIKKDCQHYAPSAARYARKCPGPQCRRIPFQSRRILCKNFRVTQAADILSKGTRIIVLAPHPDDESLGVGGLIQQAVAAGAELRVIFVTDGDNNPWPQRWIERRWSIDGECRRRWGARRRAEALRALEKLGLPASQVDFFGFPDAGILPLWRRRDAAVLDKFIRTFAAWPADALIPPSPEDRHPDHKGVFHFAREALMKLDQHPPQFSYLIHPAWLAVEPSDACCI